MEYYERRHTAEILGVTPDTIDSYRRKGVLEPSRLPCKDCRTCYSGAEIARFLTKRIEKAAIHDVLNPVKNRPLNDEAALSDMLLASLREKTVNSNWDTPEIQIPVPEELPGHLRKAVKDKIRRDLARGYAAPGSRHRRREKTEGNRP